MKHTGMKIEAKEPTVTLRDRFKRFAKTFGLSIYPDAYNRFSQKRYSQGLTYFLYVLLMSMIIFMVAFFVMLPSYLDKFDNEFSKFDDLSLNVSMKLSNDVELFDGKIRVSESGNYSGESFLITQDSIYTKKTHCNLVPLLCIFGEDYKVKSTSELYELEKQSSAIKASFIAFLSLAFPLVLILYLVIVGFETLFAVSIGALLIFMLTKTLKIKLSIQQSFLIVLYSSTIYLIAYPINALIYGLYYLHLIIPLVLSLLGMFLVGERKHRF